MNRVFLLALVLTIGFTAESAAGPFRRYFAKGPVVQQHHGPHASHPAPHVHHAPRVKPGHHPHHAHHHPQSFYRHYYEWANDVYPRYYGGFHYRHFDNLGVPPGDIGLRGNGIYFQPW